MNTFSFCCQAFIKHFNNTTSQYIQTKKMQQGSAVFIIKYAGTNDVETQASECQENKFRVLIARDVTKSVTFCYNGIELVKSKVTRTCSTPGCDCKDATVAISVDDVFDSLLQKFCAEKKSVRKALCLTSLKQLASKVQNVEFDVDLCFAKASYRGNWLIGVEDAYASRTSPPIVSLHFRRERIRTQLAPNPTLSKLTELITSF
jgi:hypothetical protein